MYLYKKAVFIVLFKLISVVFEHLFFIIKKSKSDNDALLLLCESLIQVYDHNCVVH